MLGINNESSDKKEWWFLNSLKFWNNKKEEETSQVTNEIKWELNSMFGKILVVAKWLWITTKLDEKTIADGMDKTDDKFYEIFDSSQKDVEGLLTEIGDKIKANPALSSKYGWLLSKLSQIKDWSKIEQSITSLPWWGMLLKLVTWITGKVSRLNGLLWLDKSKLIEETNRWLDELANDLRNKVDHSDEHNAENKEIIESKEIISPMIEWVITSTFDDKRDRDHNHDGEKDDHGAIDVVSYISKSLLAVADAKVVSKWFDHVYGAGNFIIIQFVYHGKTYKASYSHMLESAKLEIGAAVKKGDSLWEMWNTGHASRGAHLHFKLKEVIDGKDTIIDPLTIFDPRLFRYKQWDQNVKFDDWKGAEKYK